MVKRKVKSMLSATSVNKLSDKTPSEPATSAAPADSPSLDEYDSSDRTVADSNGNLDSGESRRLVRRVIQPSELASGITKYVNKHQEALQARSNEVVIKEVFELLRNQVDAMEDGVLAIKGLGTFSCRTVQSGGETGAVKRVVFSVAKGLG